MSGIFALLGHRHGHQGKYCCVVFQIPLEALFDLVMELPFRGP